MLPPHHYCLRGRVHNMDLDEGKAGGVLRSEWPFMIVIKAGGGGRGGEGGRM